MKDRYEQEIEQLLSELESESTGPADTATSGGSDTPPDDRPSPFAPRPKPVTRIISPVKLAVAGVILAVVGLLTPLLKWLALVGLAVMIGAVAWMVIQRMGTQQPTYWRGQRVDTPPQGVWQRFRNWLSK